jgi:hypothetical protein
MSARVDCPGIDCWSALLDERLAPEQREHIVRHLESCAVCQERIDRVPPGTDRVRRLGREFGDPTLAPPDPVLKRVLARLRAVITPTAPTEPADLYFLRPSDRPGCLGTLGGYEVREVIGQGGMGMVLKAYEPALDRVVAIKVLSPALAGSATARQRFRREAQAAAAVCHEHVVAVHGVHEADGLPYLVMQFVPGESLQARLDRCGILDADEVVRIGMQTAAGLAAAHAQGLIHRDVKPANLLLEDGLAKVKITDFGLARTADDVGLTRDGVVAGTPEYMAPEQARGEAIDHRADLFSLGCVLYALCTGVPPFRGRSAVAVLRRVSDEEPAAIRSMNPAVPAWLEAMVTRLLAKDPAARFPGAAEVAALFEGYIAHLLQPAAVHATELPAPGPLPGFAPRTRSRRWLVALLSLVALGLAVGRWLPAGGVTGPEKQSRELLFLSLRGGPADGGGFEFFGPDVDECVRFEPAGLCLTLPRGFPDERPGTGLTIPVAANGDFEITVSFEILQEPKPADAGKRQTLFALDAILDAPGHTAATIAWKVDARRGPQFLAWMTVWDEVAQKDQTRGKGFRTAAKSGRLRLVRTGSALSYQVSESPDGEFVLLETFPFAAEDLKAVRLLGSTGGSNAALEVRVTDLHVRAGALPDVPETIAPPEKSPGRGWLAAGVIVGLVIASCVLCAWLHVRRGRRLGNLAESVSRDGAARPETSPPIISFACSACGTLVKARADQAGRKGKCPRCGKAIAVPGGEAGEAG